jgi:Putative prokaryotic signal transducing protein
MDVTRQELAAHFALLNDNELLRELQSAELTESAKAVAAEELRRRGIDVPSTPIEPAKSEEAPDDLVIDGDLVILDRVLTPAEAHMLRGRLELEGIPATVTDDNMAQILSPMLIGGVRVLVPESYLERARAITQAIKRGDYALDD